MARRSDDRAQQCGIGVTLPAHDAGGRRRGGAISRATPCQF
jgi:hypothetical protein